MSISLPNRAIAAGLAIAVALWLSGTALLVPAAQAVTIEELQAQIAALQAQLATLTGGTSGDCYAFTRSLFEGLSGADVTALQDYLTGTGHFTFAGGSTGFFGPITAAAVAAWQAANGVSPAAGYFGPISQAKYNTVCGGGTGTTGGTTDLEGGAGSIEDADFVANLSNEEVGEDADDVEVAGLDIDADEGSDIELTAVRLDFDKGAAGNADFEDYAKDVSVLLDGEELARVDGDAFNDDNNYDRTLSLDSGGVIKAGDTGRLVVAVSGVSNLDSDDVTDTWTVIFESVRFRDAQGASVSETSAGDIGTETRTFSFESFATASDSVLKIKLANNDAINKAHMINVDTSGTTDGVVVLDFTLEAEGDSDLEIKEFGASTTVTVESHVDDVIAGGTSPAVYLVIDGERYGNAVYGGDVVSAVTEDTDGDVGTSELVFFDDVDYILAAGETVDAQIEVDFLAAGGSPLSEGATLLVSINEINTNNTALVDVRDESNTQLADADMSGSAIGEANSVYDVTFAITNVTKATTAHITTDTSGIDESATFEFEFDLTAEDGDVYVDDACNEDSDGTLSEDGFLFSANASASFSYSCLLSSAADQNATNYQVDDGTTETFTYTITVTADQGADDTAKLTWEQLEWSEADEAGDRSFTGNLDKYFTEGIFLNDR